MAEADAGQAHAGAARPGYAERDAAADDRQHRQPRARRRERAGAAPESGAAAGRVPAGSTATDRRAAGCRCSRDGSRGGVEAAERAARHDRAAPGWCDAGAHGRTSGGGNRRRPGC
jgi:hypothetical protein